MATRTRRNWKPDPRGYYARQIGWERSKSGKLQQHKFLLGTDRKEAERRERKLRELWDRFVEGSTDTRPLWPDDLMVVAKRIAKGIPEIPIPRGVNEKQCDYAARIQRMQAKYPVVLFLPEDQHAFEVGQAALEMFEAIPDGDVTLSPVDADVIHALGQAANRLAEAGIAVPPELAALTVSTNGNGKPLFGTMKPHEAPPIPKTEKQSKPVVRANEASSRPEAVESRPSRTASATLYQAFRSYQKFLDKEYFRPETEQISPWVKENNKR